MRRGWSDQEQAEADARLEASGQMAEVRKREAEANRAVIDTGVDPRNGAKLLPGTVAPDFGGGQYGGDRSGYDADVARNRAMGDASNGRAAVQLDQTQANETRGLQMGSLGMLRDAAMGQAPSRAAVLGQMATSSAMRDGLAASGAARGGPGAAIAAARGAQGGAANTMVHANAGISDMRANEMAQAQSQYAGGAQHAQSQDIGAATMNAQLEAQQRAMNEARQQGFERRGWNVRNMQSSGEDRYKRNVDAALNLTESNNLAEQARDSAQARETTNMALSAVSAVTSDERTKRDVHPLAMGSLSHLMRK